jgi:hypothetical protein
VQRWHDAKKGFLARTYGGEDLPLEVCESAAGYYIGTKQDGEPFTRESAEYWPTRTEAEAALRRGRPAWTQRLNL